MSGCVQCGTPISVDLVFLTVLSQKRKGMGSTTYKFNETLFVSRIWLSGE